MKKPIVLILNNNKKIVDRYICETLKNANMIGGFWCDKEQGNHFVIQRPVMLDGWGKLKKLSDHFVLD